MSSSSGSECGPVTRDSVHRKTGHLRTLTNRRRNGRMTERIFREIGKIDTFFFRSKKSHEIVIRTECGDNAVTSGSGR